MVKVTFLGYMRLQNLCKILIPSTDNKELDEAKKIDAFGQIGTVSGQQELGAGHKRSER